MPSSTPLQVGITVNEDAPELNVDQLACLLQSAARAEGGQGEVGVWICSDDEIADLHLRYMEIAGPTDVLSFAGDPPYLGDIAVSFDTASEQAVDAHHSIQREIAYLALHGLLHLLGYDDLTPEDRQHMLFRQDELMAQFEMGSSDVW
jgi:probable rRNA maturation factor